MSNHQLRRANTIRVFKTLLVGYVMFATFIILHDHKIAPSAQLPTLAVVAATAVSYTENTTPTQADPLEVSVTLSFEVDFGDVLNRLFREAISTR